MNYRILGKTGLRVSELGMGCSGIGRTMYRRDDNGAVATLQESLDAGINHFDTAPGYSSGESERLIGTAFGRNRDEVIIVSKVGVRGKPLGRFAKRYKHLVRPVHFLLRPFQAALPRFYRSQRRVDFSRGFIAGSLEKSLKRLRTDYLDVLLMHHPTPEALTSMEVRDTFMELKNSGKIRHWGVSADTLGQAMLCLKIPEVDVVQLETSMMCREQLDDFLGRAKQMNIGVVARKVLEQGILTGTTAPTKADRWATDKECLREIKGRVAQLGFLATGGRTLAQAALLFMRGLEGVATVVVGYSSVEHLRENIAAYDLPLLSEDEYRRIRAL